MQVTKRALVIGAGGFVGRHLATAMAETGWVVTGAGRDGPPEAWDSEWVVCDLRSPERVLEAVAETRPGAVVHAAGAPADAFDELQAVNVVGTERLLDAIAASAGGCRLVVIGSAAEYGSVAARQLPVAETVQPRPVSRYGEAKAAQTLVALRPGANAVVARLFNASGPGEPPSLVAGAFASQIAALERAGTAGTITVGALEPERDFIDVRDAARAIAALAERGAPGEAYNVCTGAATGIGEVLAMLVAKSNVTVDVRHDAARGGGPGVPTMVGSAAKLTARTGWRPEISLERTLTDVLDSYRAAA